MKIVEPRGCGTVGHDTVSYTHPAVWRALGATIAGVSLLVGLSCQILAFILVLFEPDAGDNSPAEASQLAAGALLVAEMLALIGVGELVWGVPAGLRLFRWRLTVSNDDISFHGRLALALSRDRKLSRAG